MKTPTFIVIHHTAVSYDKNPDQWSATNNYHQQKWNIISSLGFYGGYNYEIAKNGSVKQFREDGAVTVAQYQKNLNDGRAISICLDGNFDVELPTPEQASTLARMLQEKMDQYGILAENIFCHRAVATYKSCPGKLLPDDIYAYFINQPTIPLSPFVPQARKPALGLNKKKSTTEVPLSPFVPQDIQKELNK